MKVQVERGNKFRRPTQTKREISLHGKTCGNAVFNDPKHLVLSFSHASNELCICSDLWCAMLNPLPLPQCGILHGFFTGSQLGKPKLHNLRK